MAKPLFVDSLAVRLFQRKHNTGICQPSVVRIRGDIDERICSKRCHHEHKRQNVHLEIMLMMMMMRTMMM